MFWVKVPHGKQIEKGWADKHTPIFPEHFWTPQVPVWKMSEGPAVKIPTLVIITKMEHTCTCRLSGRWHIRQPPKVLGEPVAGSIMLHSGEVVQLSRQSRVQPICRTLPARHVSKVRSCNSLHINIVLWHLMKPLWINILKQRLLTSEKERGLTLA